MALNAKISTGPPGSKRMRLGLVTPTGMSSSPTTFAVCKVLFDGRAVLEPRLGGNV
jgi:hypothetical protein